MFHSRGALVDPWRTSLVAVWCAVAVFACTDQPSPKPPPSQAAASAPSAEPAHGREALAPAALAAASAQAAPSAEPAPGRAALVPAVKAGPSAAPPPAAQAPPPAMPHSAMTPPGAPRSDYLGAVATLDAAIRFHEAAGEAGAHPLRLAEALMDRARLTGHLDDTSRAGALLDAALSGPPRTAAHSLARASLHATLHRLDEVEADLRVALSGAVVQPETRMAAAGLRGDIALQRGQYDEARAQYEAAAHIRRSHGNVLRLANLAWKTGDRDAAESLVTEALSHLPARGRNAAFYHLQRGLLDLDRGRVADAEAHYRAADAAFGGWWLIQEHLAEAMVLQGRAADALPLYRAAVEATGDPELIDALADTLTDLGGAQEATALRARADARFDALLRDFPEAAWGHALEHLIAHGSADRALELARRNVALRPGGEARVLLARALLRSGEADEAAREVDAVLATPFRSGALHAAASTAYAAAGRKEEAAVQRAAALAWSPLLAGEAAPPSGPAAGLDRK